MVSHSSSYLKEEERLSAWKHCGSFVSSWRSHLSWGLALGVLLLTFSSSCVVGGDCVYDTDCLGNELCTDRKCHKFAQDAGILLRNCRFDSDCSGQQVCNAGKCRSGSSLFDSIQQESPGSLPDRVGVERWRPEQGQPTDRHREQGASDVIPERGRPPPLGKPPIQQSVSAGALYSSTSKYRHIAVVGQLTPLPSKTTVMRSGSYSMRPGIVAVTMW